MPPDSAESAPAVPMRTRGGFNLEGRDRARLEGHTYLANSEPAHSKTSCRIWHLGDWTPVTRRRQKGEDS